MTTADPHVPYIYAALAALGPATTLRSIGSDWETDDHLLMTCYIETGYVDNDDNTLGLAWDQDRGWLWGYERPTGGLDHVRNLDTPTDVPTPAEVAAAVLAAHLGTPPADADPAHPQCTRPYPTEIAEYYERGDINRETADVLAAYWILATVTDRHISRGYHDAIAAGEFACGCPRASCGLVIEQQALDDCPHHSRHGSETMRHRHPGFLCPGEN